MLDFRVHALTAQGLLEERLISASNEDEARQDLYAFRLGYIRHPTDKKSRSLFKANPQFDLAIFSYELLCLLKAGLSLIETLETLKERLQQGQAGFALLSELIRQMREGQSFSNALKTILRFFHHYLQLRFQRMNRLVIWWKHWNVISVITSR